MFRSLAPVTVWLLVAILPAFAEDSEPLAVKSKTTWGAFGPPRLSSLVAGDVMFIQHTVSGFSHNSEGYFEFSMTKEVLNSNKEVLSSKAVEPFKGLDETTTISLPDEFVATPEFKPGTYFHVVHVTDNISGKSVKSEMRIQVVEPRGVAIFGLQCCTWQSAKSSFPIGGATAVVGDKLKATFAIANFATDNSKMKCKLTMSILDADGRPIKWGPKVKTKIAELDRSPFDKAIINDFSVDIVAFRPGKFIACICVEDLIGKTETTEYLPFQILDPPDWSIPKTAQKKQTSGKKLNR